ncbi:putative membrane protein [Chlamydia ibidis]|uniref:Membrane protein n=2 Tax=Chlamydia ibidis TaxID=1405396 RepID=A0ABP2XDM1_9CHLA|nr:membrane protein [Chlamydia ibidis]EPP35306.1 putative membrane protein [Chlamydia ibidis]EQM62546.1 putative membrane protein [Chlamydia ibidis 10-1398/6]
MDKETVENIYKHFRYRFFKLSILPAFLGLLLIFTPITLDYQDTQVILSERICGSLLIFLAILSFRVRAVLWVGVFIGIWVTWFACYPERSSLVFANDTLLGFAILALVCIPPTRPDALEVGPTLPEGIAYNPSAGGRRAAVLFLSLLGWLQSRYLTASLLGISSEKFDCDNQIYTVMMITYSILVVLALSGGERRWHTRPKIVLATACALIVVVISSLWSIIQGDIRFDCWICLCLAVEPAFAVVFAYDEILATSKYLAQFSKDKKNLLKTALLGSEYYRDSLFWEERTVLPFGKACQQAFRGISFPLHRLAAIVLTFTFVKMNYGMALSNGARSYINICGWFIIVLSIISFAESLRHFRWLCLIFSIAILLSPVVFHLPLHAPMLIPTIFTGIALVFLSIGKISPQKK